MGLVGQCGWKAGGPGVGGGEIIVSACISVCVEWQRFPDGNLRTTEVDGTEQIRASTDAPGLLTTLTSSQSTSPSLHIVFRACITYQPYC